jgi:CBS domain-containing protein
MFVDRIVPTARKRLVTILESAQLIEAAKLLGKADTDIVVVCASNGLLVGVITKTDVVNQISHCQGNSCTTAASSVMTREVVVCQSGDLLYGVWSKMKERRLKNIPITDLGSRPIGVLNARDALEILLQEVEDEELLLREYVMCVGYH